MQPSKPEVPGDKECIHPANNQQQKLLLSSQSTSKQIKDLEMRKSEAESEIDTLMDQCFSLSELNSDLNKKLVLAEEEKKNLRKEKMEVVRELDKLYSKQIQDLSNQVVTSSTTEVDQGNKKNHIRRSGSLDTCNSKAVDGTNLEFLVEEFQGNSLSRANSSVDVKSPSNVVKHPLKQLNRLSVHEVSLLLIKLELVKYVDSFRNHSVNGKKLSCLKKDDLDNLNVAWIHQRLLTQALDKFKAEGGIPVQLLQNDDGCKVM